MENQLTVDNIQDLLRSLIEGYQDSFNEQNEKWEIAYTTTITHHKVPTDMIPEETKDSAKSNVDVAYLRLTKKIRPRGGKDEDWEEHLVYHQSYRFKDIKERINPAAPWKFYLYMDLLFKLTSAGLEYSELLRRVKNTKETGVRPDLAVIEKPPIIVTDQMPAPLTDKEREYQEWVKKNHDTP